MLHVYTKKSNSMKVRVETKRFRIDSFFKNGAFIVFWGQVEKYLSLIYLCDVRVAIDNPQQPVISYPWAIKEAQRRQLSFGFGCDLEKGLIGEPRTQLGLNDDAMPEEVVSINGVSEGSVDSLEGQGIWELEVAQDQKEGPLGVHLIDG